MAVGNYRPHANLSDAELNKRLQHSLNALNQAQQAGGDCAQAAKDLSNQLSQAGASHASYNPQIPPNTTSALPQNYSQGAVTYLSPSFIPTTGYITTTSTPLAYWGASATDTLGLEYEAPKSKKELKLQKRVDKVFGRLHDQVARDLQLA